MNYYKSILSKIEGFKISTILVAFFSSVLVALFFWVFDINIVLKTMERIIEKTPGFAGITIMTIYALVKINTGHRFKQIFSVLIILGALFFQLLATMNGMFLNEHMQMKIYYLESILEDNNITAKNIKRWEELNEYYNNLTGFENNNIRYLRKHNPSLFEETEDNKISAEE